MRVEILMYLLDKAVKAECVTITKSSASALIDLLQKKCNYLFNSNKTESRKKNVFDCKMIKFILVLKYE